MALVNPLPTSLVSQKQRGAGHGEEKETAMWAHIGKVLGLPQARERAPPHSEHLPHCLNSCKRALTEVRGMLTGRKEKAKEKDNLATWVTHSHLPHPHPGSLLLCPQPLGQLSFVNGVTIHTAHPGHTKFTFSLCNLCCPIW